MTIKTLAAAGLAVVSLIGCAADEAGFDYGAIAVSGDDIFGLTADGLEFAQVDAREQSLPPPETLAVFPAPTSGIDDRIVVGERNVYFNRSEGLYEWARDDGMLTFIDDSTRFDFVVANDDFFYLRANRYELVRRGVDGVDEVVATPPEFSGVLSFATNGHALIWSTFESAWITTIPNGVTATPLGPPAANLTIHDGFAYLANRGAIARVPLEGGDVEEVVTVANWTPRPHFDRGSMYWQGSATSIDRMRLDDRATETLVDGDHHIRDIGIGDEHLFYVLAGRQIAERAFVKATARLMTTTL